MRHFLLRTTRAESPYSRWLAEIDARPPASPRRFQRSVISLPPAFRRGDRNRTEGKLPTRTSWAPEDVGLSAVPLCSEHHRACPDSYHRLGEERFVRVREPGFARTRNALLPFRSEEHTSELQSLR